jgi:aminopeptidase 2
MKQFGKLFPVPLIFVTCSRPLSRYRSIPLGLVTASAQGQALIDNTAILEVREAEFKLDTAKPFKINADTNGVCMSFHLAYRETELILCQDRVLYEPTRLAAIASEAAKPDSIFSLADRMGLVHDAFALAKAGYLPLSSALNLVYELRVEEECESLVLVIWLCAELTRGRKVLVWDSINACMAGIVHTWWEDDKITRQLNAFRRVRSSLQPTLNIYVSLLDFRHCTHLW